MFYVCAPACDAPYKKDAAITFVALFSPAGLPLNTVIFIEIPLNPLAEQSVMITIP